MPAPHQVDCGTPSDLLIKKVYACVIVNPYEGLLDLASCYNP
jgi:hypothetical protein